MEKDIQQSKYLFQQLIAILKKEFDQEVLSIINQLELGIQLIDEYANNHYDEKQLYMKLERIYININQPRVGLSDYFIWRDDYDERVKANESLDAIKDNLLRLFKDY